MKIYRNGGQDARLEPNQQDRELQGQKGIMPGGDWETLLHKTKREFLVTWVHPDREGVYELQIEVRVLIPDTDHSVRY